MTIPKLGVGAVLALDEKDYLYGTGTLNIRLTRVDVDPAHFPAMEWVEASGFPIYPNGATGASRPVTIRVSAIAASLRPTDWLPDL